MAIYKEDIVSIELSNGAIHRSFLNHSIGTGDNSANRFGIRVFRNGSEVDLSGASCQAYFQNAEGTNIALTSYGTVSGNVAYVTLPQACYNVEGQFCLAIKLIGGGVTGTMRIIDGMVCNTGTTGAVAPTSSVPTYQEILSTYAAMVSATSAANLAIAEEFDASKNYPASKNVINDGALYVLPNGHTAGTTWANTTKVVSNLGDQVTDLKSALNSVSNLDYEGKETFLTHGIFANGGLNEDGSLKPSQTWRVSNITGNKMSFSRDIIVSVKSGYRWGLFTDHWIGWITSNYTISSGTEFAIQIDKNPTEGSGVADIVEYVSALTFESVLSKRVSQNTTDIQTANTTFTNSIAKPYSDQKTYKVGEYCLQGGYVRRCISPITTPETFTASHWSKDPITEDILLNKDNDLSTGWYLYKNQTPVTQYHTFDMINGYIDEDGTYADNLTQYIRSKGAIPIDNTKDLIIITSSSSFSWTLRLYDDRMNHIRKRGAYTDTSRKFTTSDLSDARYIAICGRKTDSSAITPYDFTLQFYQQETLPLDNLNKMDHSIIATVADGLGSNGISKTLVFEQGRYYSGTGLPSDDYFSGKSKWIRTKEPIVVSHKFPIIITRTHNLTGKLYEYDEDGNWLNERTLSASWYGIDITLNSATCYVNIGLNSESDITPSSGDTTTIKQIFAEGDSDEIPDYFKTQIDSKLPTIIQNMNDAGRHGETFIFITDIHWETNYKKSPALIDYILKRTNIKYIICGGDLINDGQQSAMYNTAINCVKSFQFPLANMFFPVARGNHDDNSNQVPANQFSFGAVYNILMNQVANQVHLMELTAEEADESNNVSKSNFSFYFDHESTKTRFIIYDTGDTSSSDLHLATLRDVLYTVQEGWKVIVVCHFLLNHSTGYYFSSETNMGKMLRDYNSKTSGSVTYVDYDFSNSHGDVIFWIGGHTHSDESLAYNDESNIFHILAINTDTDSYRDHPDTEGTVNSQCFDVVTVNYADDAKTVKCVRIGRGSDRSFVYGETT